MSQLPHQTRRSGVSWWVSLLEVAVDVQLPEHEGRAVEQDDGQPLEVAGTVAAGEEADDQREAPEQEVAALLVVGRITPLRHAVQAVPAPADHERGAQREDLPVVAVVGAHAPEEEDLAPEAEGEERDELLEVGELGHVDSYG